MSKITANEFWKEWIKSENGEGVGVIFQLSSEQIQEWIKLGKFSKIKEYCHQLPYDVKFTCLEPFHELYEKSFGFIFQNKEDASRLLGLVDVLREIRSYIKVQAVVFSEVPAEPREEPGHTLPKLRRAYCSLVI